MSQQLNLVPEQHFKPKFRKVMLDELPDVLPGPEPTRQFTLSIKTFGVLEPIAVVEAQQGYVVGFGRRRIKAARKAGHLSIPAMVYPAGSVTPEALTLTENEHRSDNVVAKLEAISQLRGKATPEEICQQLGLNKTKLNVAVKLLDGLVPELLDALKEGRMALTSAKKAAKLDRMQQCSLAELDKIRGQDVDDCRRVKAEAQIAALPDSLFAPIPQVSWQRQAMPLMEQLLQVIPEGEGSREAIQQAMEALMVAA